MEAKIRDSFIQIEPLGPYEVSFLKTKPIYLPSLQREMQNKLFHNDRESLPLIIGIQFLLT